MIAAKEGAWGQPLTWDERVQMGDPPTPTDYVKATEAKRLRRTSAVTKDY